MHLLQVYLGECVGCGESLLLLNEPRIKQRIKCSWCGTITRADSIAMQKAPTGTILAPTVQPDYHKPPKEKS